MLFLGEKWKEAILLIQLSTKNKIENVFVSLDIIYLQKVQKQNVTPSIMAE